MNPMHDNARGNVLILIPAFNEEQNLKSFLPALISVAQEINADILGVNDASTDQTKEVFKRHQICALNHPIQMGYGITLQTGYKYARRNGYGYVVQLDGDGQHDPRFIPEMVNQLKSQTSDVVLGSRFLPHPSTPFQPQGRLYHGTPIRRVGIILFRAILHLLCLRSVSDPTSGYMGLNRKTVEFFCGKSFPFDYPDADIILTLFRNGFLIQEIPVYMYWNETGGFLHRGCKPIWYVIKVTLALLIASLRRREMKHG